MCLDLVNVCIYIYTNADSYAEYTHDRQLAHTHSQSTKLSLMKLTPPGILTLGPSRPCII